MGQSAASIHTEFKFFLLHLGGVKILFCGRKCMSLEGRIFENELMRAAMDTARIGLCVIAADGRILVLGGDVEVKLGVPQGILVGQHFRHLLATSGLVLRAGADLLSLDASEISVEARLSRQDGSMAILMFQARTLAHGAEDRYRVLTIIDITDFGITRDRFLDLRRQLDALNSAVVISDAKRPDMPIVYVNKRFEQMTGYAAEYAIGRNCRFLQGADREQPGVHKLVEAIKRRQSCQVMLNNYRRDGSLFFNELFISPVFDESGDLTHYIGLQRQCNERTTPSDIHDTLS